MNNKREESFVIKETDPAVDDFNALWRCHPRAFFFFFLILLAPVAISVFAIYDIIALRNQITEKDNQIARMTMELQDTKSQKDKLEIQLAPFLVIANQSFPQDTTDKQLELLLGKLGRQSPSLSDQSAATKNTSQRVISDTTVQTLIYNLKVINPIVVQIITMTGDEESAVLANQIKGIFESSGWKIGDVVQINFNEPPKYITLTSQRKAMYLMYNALQPLFTDLGYKMVIDINENLPDDTVTIIVGSK